MGSSAIQETSSDLRDRIAAGVAVLREGGVVAYPTDTVYGLGADIECSTAVQRIIQLKGMRKPVPTHNVIRLRG